MAVAVMVEIDGGTLDQYDQVQEKLGFSAGGPGPPGALFHWVTATDSGIQVTDVWESREQFDSFIESKVGPAMAEVGMPGPPKITGYEVHNHMTAG